MSTNGFHKKIIGFSYAKENGRWMLGPLIGEREALELGIHHLLKESPPEPPPAKSDGGFVPILPEIHLTRIVKVLGRCEPPLDHAITMRMNNHHIQVEIEVKSREQRPQYQERTWEEKAQTP